MPENHRAVAVHKKHGVKKDVYKEGWHLKVPWLEKAEIYDLNPKTTTIETIAPTKGKYSKNATMLTKGIQMVFTLINFSNMV